MNTTAHDPNNDDQNSLGDKSTRYRHIWGLAWPILLSNITLPLVGAVDVAVMGHLPDPVFVGGVALGALIFNFFYMFFGFLRMGTTGLAARAYGSGNIKENQLILARAASIAVLVGFSFILLYPLIVPFAIWVFEADAVVEQLMSDYVSIRIYGVPAALLNITLLGWLYGQQAMRIGMAQLLLVNLLNIGLSLLFVMGFGWQVAGVAAASVGAQWGGLSLTLGLVWYHRRRFQLDQRLFDTDALLALAPWLHFFSLSRDLIIRTALLFLVEFVLITQAAKTDILTLASMQILIVVFGLIAYGLDGFAHATEALVGQAIGQHRPDNLMRIVRRSTLLGIFAACLMSLILAIGAPFIVPLFTNQPDLIAEVRAIWFWAVLIPPLSVLAFQMDGVFVGAAQGKEMRNAMILSVLLFGIFVVILQQFFGHVDQLDALLFAFIMYLMARGVILWLRLDIVRRQAT